MVKRLIPYADIVTEARFEFKGKEYKLPKNAVSL